MNKQVYALIMIIVATFFLMQEQHYCKWPLCPYQGIEKASWKEAVIEEVGNEGSDAYYIDMLHLEFPTLEYDQLEELLFNSQKQKKIEKSNNGLVTGIISNNLKWSGLRKC